MWIRLLLVVVLFSVLIYAIFGAALRDRYALGPRSSKYVSWAVLTVELLMLAMALRFLPLLRKPIGLLIAVPALFATHQFLSVAVVGAMRRRGWIRAGEEAEIITVTPGTKRSRLVEWTSRYFYLVLAVAYVLVFGIVFVIQHFMGRL